MNLRFCPSCKIYLVYHPEFSMDYKYKRCTICGFTHKVEKVMEIITEKAFFMGRDATYKNELTQELMDNAKKLLEKVNKLLTELNITKATVTSGWRPAAINAATAGSAKKSLHMVCKAVDILDDADQTLAKLILANPDLLKKYDLWIEDPASTKGKNTNWVHLDFGTRTDRPLRMFKI